MPWSKIAALAPLVFQAAEKKDEVAEKLLKHAVDSLSV
jgi:N-acetylglucosamine kinase-like BadF-type ATPase